ncbi:MAG: 5'-methylthioadenosine/S-adenosylhomocysteine nucleosidase [Anaerolineaceae bacterium]|nr:5'-methylthioadenosine/S-adenosylhomocysteine nucleosidase [Anaerolineaceae bacterium]
MFNRIINPIILVLALFLSGCVSSLEIQTSLEDDISRLAIISAFEPELKVLLDEAQIDETYVINGRSFHAGQLAGQDVVLFESGVSMVNASMTTQMALDHFNIRGIVFSGIAGGVNPELNIGDVVVPAQWGQYQEQLFARETEDGWDLGWNKKEFDNFEMMFPQKVSLTHKGGKADKEENIFWFQVDQQMLEVAEKAIGSIDLEKCTNSGKCLDTEPRVVLGGNGVSGSTFVDNASYRDYAWETFQVDALDMETAAVAHVAYANQVPYIAFRSLSDLAGGGDGQNEIITFFKLASSNSAKVLLSFLKELDGN